MLEQKEGYRLSPHQRRVWDAKQRDGQGLFTFMEITILAKSKSPEEVKQTIQNWMGQSELLSIQFREMAGFKYPVQYLIQDSFSFCYEDWSTSTEEEKQVKHRLEKEKHSFVAVVEKTSITLIRWNEGEYRLFLQAPSMLLDQRVMPLLSNLANAFKQADTTEEEISYIAVSDWLNSIVESEEAAPGREYWMQQLQKADSDGLFQNSQQTSSLGNLAYSSFEIIKQPFDSVKSLPFEEALLAAWIILLEKLYGKQPLVGLGMASEEEELQDLLGNLTAYVPLALSIDHFQSFRQFLAAIEQRLNNHKEWQEIFESGYLDWGQKQGGYSCGFEYQRVKEVMSHEGLSLSVASHLHSSHYFPLRISVLEYDSHFEVQVYYDSLMFEASLIEKLVARYQLLYNRAAADLDQPIWKLSPLLESEQTVNQDSTKVQRQLPYTTVVAGFSEQVKSNPDKAAIVYHDKTYTFADLQHWSNQIGSKLGERGEANLAGKAIGICMERSPELVAAILAILKLGAYYVPIDPLWPVERIEFIKRHNQLHTVLLDQTNSKKLPDGVMIVPAFARDEKENEIDEKVCPNLVAYTIYTSGSTGNPKGVMIEHQQLMEYVESFRKKVPFKDDDQLAYFNPIAADIGNTLLFTSLSYGLTLHILSNEVAYNSTELAKYMQTHSIAAYKITPTHFRYLQQGEVGPNQIMPQKHLIFGGEALSQQLLDSIQSDSLQIYNHYGPTEATIGVTIQPLAESEKGREIPIGVPFEHVELLILDRYMQPVPEGVYGELFIGGTSLGRGYYGQSEMTAAAYVPHPNKCGERMYRTGDMVKRIGNQYFFHSRKDHQVKINGYRIELGEIASTAEQLEPVKQAVAIVREDKFGNLSICLYLIPTGNILDLDSVKNHLKQVLPEYMMPLYYQRLEQFPFTSSGKIDVRALPLPNQEQDLNDDQEPETEIQHRIAAVWKNVLGIEQVGIYSNFFAIGGHSLLATKVIVQLREEFGLELPLRQLFEASTIKGLEEEIEKLLLEEIYSMSEEEVKYLLESYEGD